MGNNIQDIKNEQIKGYAFLAEMYEDQYFPDFLVDKESKDLDALYKLTHAFTNKFNDLEQEFGDNDSEIETVARECISSDFVFIAEAYGYDADREELIATRDW